MNLKPAGHYLESETCQISSGNGNGELDKRTQHQPESPFRAAMKETPLTPEDMEFLARIAPLSFGEDK